MTGPAREPAPSDTWLAAEGDRLLSFAEGARDPRGGFGWLDDRGDVDLGRPVQTWVTARMTYVFALAHLRGRPGADALADHGLTALRGQLHDHEYGGWFSWDPRHGGEQDKSAYDHAFVALAAAAGVLAGRPGADELLTDAVAVLEGHFWDERAGLCMERWDRAWRTSEPYRGTNSNMHMTEAFLAVADATGDGRWRERAHGIAQRLVHTHARTYDWRLPEHFDEDWQVLPGYNRDRPADPFRPYGATVGHWFEWSRLLTHLHVAAADPPPWLLDDARALFAAGVSQGWAVDDADGFVYTVDWDGAPVVRHRMHWVVAEAIAAAHLLADVAGDGYDRWVRTWWDYVAAHLLDTDAGSWHHELDPENHPTSTVWQGKPDVYHAYQCVLVCLSPAASSVAAAVRPAADRDT